MIRYALFQKRLFCLCSFLILLNISLIAQEKGYFTISIELLTDLSRPSLQAESTPPKQEEKERFFTASAEDEFTPKGDISRSIPSYFRAHKNLPNKFSGFVIELLQTENKLERDYPLFERFGNVHVQQLANGKYSYCIIADFRKAKSVKIFAEEVIAPHAPDAKAFKYKKGKRKKM